MEIPDVAIKQLAFLLPIKDVPDSNLVVTAFLGSDMKLLGQYLKIGHNHALLNPLQFNTQRTIKLFDTIQPKQLK
jgi:hypothetical protein